MEPIPPPAAVLTLSAWMHGDQIVARLRAVDPGVEGAGVPDGLALVGDEAILDAVRGWLDAVRRNR